MLIRNESISNETIKLENNLDVPACVIISNKKSIKNCWNNGFYGKGNLSRSEPDWTERILKDIIQKNSGHQTIINCLRNNPKQVNTMNVNKDSYRFLNKLNNTSITFKISKSINYNKQLLVEIQSLGLSLIQDLFSIIFNPYKFFNYIKNICENLIIKKVKQKCIKSSDLLNMEYLQLDLVEAFFLKYALNCISIKNKNKEMSIDNCWNKFRKDINNPADLFILKYVAYHYYRSQGWIVKEGLKYGVDYVLYQKGPAFSHSEFAISIIPVLEDQDNLNYINKLPTVHEINCTNRVCNQVLKKLVFCYIIIPKNINLDSADCLKMYKIYEVRLKRWNPDKTRN
ncbi:tRNA-intron endonuclease catalytic domain-like protein [Anaeromyces robustus]|uniref:tRNA-splicing endonuclease subunit Sen2 n=1 Tax=Anaeromyces robustus TaxID=1754192 RepID=A0A1Y1VSE0_9FUNG|nr:tRNA-intron endonuclease catalytic domain-like protein [Anaeromyces robustus]|eukprot:ORX64208.1 tRNA-intron endonuclease catalytic domain-like protein [Anaeromyces robustus]